MKSHLTPLRRVTKEAKKQNAVEEEDKGASCMLLEGMHVSQVSVEKKVEPPLGTEEEPPCRMSLPRNTACRHLYKLDFSPTRNQANNVLGGQ